MHFLIYTWMYKVIIAKCLVSTSRSQSVRDESIWLGGLVCGWERERERGGGTTHAHIHTLPGAVTKIPVKPCGPLTCIHISNVEYIYLYIYISESVCVC